MKKAALIAAFYRDTVVLPYCWKQGRLCAGACYTGRFENRKPAHACIIFRRSKPVSFGVAN
jgi:hypothetical protein